MKPREELLASVRGAIENARENGYDVGCPCEELALDMVVCDADLENETPDRVAQAILEIRDLDGGEPIRVGIPIRVDPIAFEIRAMDTISLAALTAMVHGDRMEGPRDPRENAHKPRRFKRSQRSRK